MICRLIVLSLVRHSPYYRLIRKPRKKTAFGKKTFSFFDYALLEGVDVLLRNGVGEERGVLTLRREACFEGCAFGGIRESGLGCLRSGFQRVLRLDVLGVFRLGGVQEVDTQLLFAAGATFEVERFRLVELAHHAGKHSMQCDFSHVLMVLKS